MAAIFVTGIINSSCQKCCAAKKEDRNDGGQEISVDIDTAIKRKSLQYQINTY